MPLSRQLYARLLAFITPYLDEDSRRPLIQRAFYGLKLANIPTEGLSNDNFAALLLSEMDKYGPLEDQQHAIAHLLLILRNDVGTHFQRQIDELLLALQDEISTVVPSPAPASPPQAHLPIASPLPAAPPPQVVLPMDNPPAPAPTSLSQAPLPLEPETKPTTPTSCFSFIQSRLLRILAGGIGVLMTLIIPSIWIPGSSTNCGHLNFIECGLVGPAAPPASDFIVVVAGFGWQNADGTIVADERASAVSLAAAKILEEQLTVADQVISLQSPQFGTYPFDPAPADPLLISATPAERAIAAERLATALNADIVVYGLVQEDQQTRVYSPEFFVTALQTNSPDVLQFLALDLLHRSLVVASAQSTNLQVLDLVHPLNMIVEFSLAMTHYAPGAYRQSLPYFEAAIQQNPDDPDMALLYVLAGNAAGRAAEEEAVATRRPPDYQATFDYYQQALALQPTNPRALIGTGEVLFALMVAQGSFRYDAALTLPPRTNCLNYEFAQLAESPQQVGLLALDCYTKASNLTSAGKTLDNQEAFVRAVTGIGSLYTLFSSYGAQQWDLALAAFEQGITVYETAQEPFRPTNQTSVGHLYARYATAQLFAQNPLACDQRVQIAEQFAQSFVLLADASAYADYAAQNCTQLKQMSCPHIPVSCDS